MNQKYENLEVKSPGTVIVSATAHCNNISNIIEPVFKLDKGSIFYINLSSDDFKLGGSAFSQIIGNIGNNTPTINDSKYFVNVFETLNTNNKINSIWIELWIEFWIELIMLLLQLQPLMN